MSEDWKSKYLNMKKAEDEQKRLRAERQKRYRNSKKGKEAIKKAYNTAKGKAGFTEKTRANAKKHYEQQIVNRINSGEKITRRKVRTEKEMREKIISWNTEKPTAIKHGIFIAFKKLELQKKVIVFKSVEEYPKIDVGYIEKFKTKWTGLKYIKDNPNLYISPNKTKKKPQQKPTINSSVSNTISNQMNINSEGQVVISWD